MRSRRNLKSKRDNKIIVDMKRMNFIKEMMFPVNAFIYNRDAR